MANATPRFQSSDEGALQQVPLGSDGAASSSNVRFMSCISRLESLMLDFLFRVLEALPRRTISATICRYVVLCN